MIAAACCTILLALSAAQPPIVLEGSPPPQEGQFGEIGLRISAPWMKGYLELRIPETVQSSMGLHFIDHDRSDMQPLSMIEPFPIWRIDSKTGIASYTAITDEGIVFSAHAIPKDQHVAIEFRIRNQSEERIEHVNCQMCLVLNHAPKFGDRHNLDQYRTWIDAKWTCLSSTTPTPEEIGRVPWILVLTKALAPSYQGAREWSDGWWVVDQTADRNLLARSTSDGEHLIAIAWDEEASHLMTNTNIPCMHAGPIKNVPLEPGGEEIWRGSVYVLENNDPETLKALHDADRKAWQLTRNSTTDRTGG